MAKIDTDNMIYAAMTEVLSFGKALVPKSLLDVLDAQDGDRLQWIVTKENTVMMYVVKNGQIEYRRE